MNTFDARSEARAIALQALEVVTVLASGGDVPLNERGRFRLLASQTRDLIPDAGFPAEALWRGLQRAAIGIDTAGDETDLLFWRDVQDALEEARDTLTNLVHPAGHEPDLYVIG